MGEISRLAEDLLASQEELHVVSEVVSEVVS
jgi:hypothetical protein